MPVGCEPPAFVVLCGGGVWSSGILSQEGYGTTPCEQTNMCKNLPSRISAIVMTEIKYRCIRACSHWALSDSVSVSDASLTIDILPIFASLTLSLSPRTECEQALMPSQTPLLCGSLSRNYDTNFKGELWTFKRTMYCERSEPGAYFPQK